LKAGLRSRRSSKTSFVDDAVKKGHRGENSARRGRTVLQLVKTPPDPHAFVDLDTFGDQPLNDRKHRADGRSPPLVLDAKERVIADVAA
jgi:hypothetical protein